MNWKRLHLFILTKSWDYVGNDNKGPMCECGLFFKHPIHLQHNGDVCDILMFPCVCGSWHTKDYTDEANAEFMRKISTPGYQPTEQEAEVIKIMTNGA